MDDSMRQKPKILQEPAVISTIATGACIISSHSASSKKIALLSASYRAVQELKCHKNLEEILDKFDESVSLLEEKTEGA